MMHSSLYCHSWGNKTTYYSPKDMLYYEVLALISAMLTYIKKVICTNNKCI